MDFGPERAHFEDHGWLVLRGVLDEARVAELREASEEVFPDAAVPARSDGVPLIVRPSLHSPTLRGWLATRLPFEVAAALLGGARLLQDALLVKGAGAEAELAWHQDASYFGFLDPLEVVSVRLALTAETVASGCLWVMDGSHRGAVARDIGLGAARVEDALEDARDAAQGERLPIELAPGDVSIHHCRTFHASFPNRTATARRTLVTHVASARCRLVPTRLPPGMEPWFPTDAQGHLAPDPFWPLPLG